jgi:hypothetical protein
MTRDFSQNVPISIPAIPRLIPSHNGANVKKDLVPLLGSACSHTRIFFLAFLYPLRLVFISIDASEAKLGSALSPGHSRLNA